MANDIDFYFDFSSPYGYFAANRIDALAAKYQRAVKWRPVLLGAIFKRSGVLPLMEIPLKGEYSLHDIIRTARFHGIPYRHPSTFPISTQAPARAVLWLQNNAGDAEAIAFAKAAYHAFFVDDINIGEPEQVKHIAEQLGLPAGAMIDGIATPAIKEQFKTAVELAVARGVFGSPYVIADSEPFWGFDRFDQLEAYLKNGTI